MPARRTPGGRAEHDPRRRLLNLRHRAALGVLLACVVGLASRAVAQEAVGAAPPDEATAAGEAAADSVPGDRPGGHDWDAEADSIRVVERGRRGATGWDIAEAPFKLVQAPFRVIAEALKWVAARAETGTTLPWALYYLGELNRRGVYPGVGSQGPNSGFGLQVIGRAPAAQVAPVWVELRAGATVKRYWEVETRAGLGAPGHDARARLEAFVAVEHRAEDEFFGLGNDSRLDDRSDYALDGRRAGTTLRLRPAAHVHGAVDVGWARSEVGPGGDDGLPDIGLVFDQDEAPGLEAAERHLFVGASAEWAVGGRHTLERTNHWIEVGYHRFFGLGEAADFHEVEASAGLELPFDHRRRSIALALYFAATRPGGGGELAFYHHPALGGATSLPGFKSQRFRERDAILGKAEYRYRLWSDPANTAWLDATIFWNEGMVAHDLGADLRFGDLHAAYGFALALLTPHSTAGRLGIAHGREGTQLDFSFGATF